MSDAKAGFRWGILGAGHIAGKWARDLEHVPDARLQAVWARDPDRRAEFAAAHAAVRIANSVSDLLDHGDLDAVYVATPHGRHHDDALACLEAGIPVLCEKAFALDSAQAVRMVDAARERKVFLMEALWTRFLPGFRKALEAAEGGHVGQILSVEADFGFHAPYDPSRRLWDPAMGGGVLLDIGLYPLFFALSFLGPVQDFELDWVCAPNGVERDLRAATKHLSGGRSSFRATFDEATGCGCRIRGSSGEIEFVPMFHAAVDAIVTANGSRTILPGRSPGNGYQFETIHVQDCVRSGRTESPLRSWNDTLEFTRLLDRFRERMASGREGRSHPGGV